MSPSENNKQGQGSQEGLWGALVASSSLPCALYEDLVWFLARAALTHPQLHIFRQQFPAFTVLPFPRFPLDTARHFFYLTDDNI